MLTSKNSTLLTIIGLAIIIFALDQTAKFLVVKNIPQNEVWSFFPALAKIFKFTFITNTGAAFGMFPQLGGVFMVIAIVVVVSIIVFYRQLPTEHFWIRMSLGLLLGGALGNLVDRITRGYVVDFVAIGFWPIFNLADLSLLLGVALLAYHLWDEESFWDQTDNMPNLSKEGGL